MASAASAIAPEVGFLTPLECGQARLGPACVQSGQSTEDTGQVSRRVNGRSAWLCACLLVA